MRLPAIIGVAAAALLFASPFVGIPGWTPALATVALFMAVCLSGLNLTFGYCGMLAFGQAAFAAIAAYGTGILSNLGVPFLLAIVIAVAITVLLARLLATIFVRLPGTYLAIATLGLAYVVEGIARAFPSLTGGASGLLLIPPFALTEMQWYSLAFACATASAAITALLMWKGYSRTVKLIGTDELGAEVVGINVAREKLMLFTAGSAFTAVGGVLLSTYSSIVTPEFGGANASLEYLAMVIIGGAGTAMGPVVGAIVLYWLFSIAGSGLKYELLIYGVSFLAVVLFAPEGVAGYGKKTLQRLFRQSERKYNAAAAAGPAGKAPAPGILAIEDIEKSFGGVRAVSQVTADFPSGQVVALLGPNGAGKSTLFNILSGIETPDTGKIMLRGDSIVGLSINRRAHVIGRSFQVPRLVNDMTVIENIVIRADQIFKGRSEAERFDIAYAQLERLGLAHIADHRVANVAVGLHKLIDLARAAVGEPPLLLLDEPAVGLTAAEIARLREIVLGFKERGAIVVVVDHNIGFIRSIADRVLVMEGGRNIAYGTCEEVLNDARVQKAYLGVMA